MSPSLFRSEIPDGQDADPIEEWKCKLGISDWRITCEAIDEMQVVDSWFNDTPGHEFVGIAIYREERVGVISHTRQLTEEEIIHELLHVRYPEWNEDQVIFWARLLLRRTDLSGTDVLLEHPCLKDA